VGTSQSTSISVLLTMNGVGVPGRLIPNYAAQKLTGPLNMLIPIVCATGVILYCWTTVTSETGLWVFSVIYGLFGAGIQGLFPVVLTSLTTDQKKTGVRAGMGFGVMSIAVLTGPPIAGVLIQLLDGSYLGMQIFAGTTMMLSTVFLLATRFVIVGTKITKI